MIVKFAGKEVPKSPFSVGVDAAPGDASKVTAAGPGIEKTGNVVNKKTYFEVFTVGKWKLLKKSQGHDDIDIEECLLL